MENKLTISKLISNLNLLSNLTNEIELRSVVQDAVIPILKDRYGKDANFSVIANSKGEFEITREYKVVSPGSYNVVSEIPVNDPKLNPDDEYEVGEVYIESVNLEDLDKRDLMTIKYRLNKMTTDLAIEYMKNKYSGMLNKVGKFIVSKIDKSGYQLTDSLGNMFFLPYLDRIPRENLYLGDEIYALITEVGLYNKVTRKSKEFVAELLKEFSDHVIDYEFIGNVRKAGIMSKLSIKCNFTKGLFDDIKYLAAKISHELNQEQVDIIIYSNNNDKYLKNCFYNVWLIDAWMTGDEGNILIDKNQLTYAIGDHGTNIKLTESLLGFHINIHVSKMPKNEDIELTEYSDEINPKLIDKLEGINITTARELMKYDVIKLPKFINKNEVRKLLELIHDDFINDDKDTDNN